MAEIRFENVSKRFGDVVVVEGLDLTINDGEFFTFVGPSGCGKSTLINMIAGLEPVTGGRILFDNAEVNELSPRERDVAMVFQSYALYPHMTVKENIAFPLRMKKIPKDVIDHEVRKVSSLLGLEALLHRMPKEISGGQRQRVALGRAIIRRPKVFLMDEPMSNLDARLRIEMRGELKRLHQELGITTVYVTHDQEEAMSLSDRIAVLSEGWVRQCDTPMNIYTRPENIFVAGFIGSPPMNIIDGFLLRDIPFLQKAYCKYNLEKVVAGIRPSDIDVIPNGVEDGLEVGVQIVEPTGGDVWVDGLWKGIRIKGKATLKEGISSGTTVLFRIPVDKVHIFDRTGGERLG